MTKFDDVYVIADFDHTITLGSSKSSWGVLETADVLPEECIKMCEKYRNYYIPLEKDLNITFDEKSTLMNDWLTKNLSLFIKYKLTKRDIDNISSRNCMKLRGGMVNLFKFLYEKNIPLIIISAGIADIIENFLKANEIFFDNIYIISNVIRYKDGYLNGFIDGKIHSLNKSSVILPTRVSEIIKDRNKVILLGDNAEDVFMVPEDRRDGAFKIGFLNGHLKNIDEYNNTFDVVFNDDSDVDFVDLILKADL